MQGFLLDTNHVSAAIRRVSPVRDHIHHVLRQGIRVGTCLPVLCEVEAGIQQTADPDAYRRRLRHLMARLRLWPIDPIPQTYGEVYLELKRQGRALSQVDMLLAALDRRMKLTLLTTDRDFEVLPDIRTENWLVPPAQP